jgi:diacylglycerol kinase family enzyme
LAYFPPIIRSISQYDFPELRISSADWQISARWAFVNNLPCYGGGLKPTPLAEGDDGLLDVCTLRHGGLFKAMQYLPYMWLGRPHALPDCTVCQTRKLRIECDAPNVPYQVDGDPGGTLPLTVELLSARLRLVVPRRFVEARAAIAAALA